MKDYWSELKLDECWSRKERFNIIMNKLLGGEEGNTGEEVTGNETNDTENTGGEETNNNE